MPTKPIAQQKFDEIMKKTFHELLKPLGFKRKGANWFLAIDKNYGQHVNVQKNSGNLGNQIEFTINIGLWLPGYFKIFERRMGYNTPVPVYPDESSCAVRYRIGDLMKTTDVWFKLTKATNVEKEITKMKGLITKYIIPFFKKYSSKEVVLEGVGKGDFKHAIQSILTTIELLVKEGYKGGAQKIYTQELKGAAKGPRRDEEYYKILIEFGKKNKLG